MGWKAVKLQDVAAAMTSHLLLEERSLSRRVQAFLSTERASTKLLSKEGLRKWAPRNLLGMEPYESPVAELDLELHSTTTMLSKSKKKKSRVTEKPEQHLQRNPFVTMGPRAL